jgi:YD repeat-containing protein
VNVAGVVTRYAYDALGGRISKSSEHGNTIWKWHLLPQGNIYYEGPAAPQTGTVGMRPQLMGGGNQIYVPKVDTRLIKPNVP